MRAMQFATGTFNDALMAYESALFEMSSNCTCFSHRDTADIESEHTWPSDVQRGQTCILALFETIILTSRITAGFLVDGGLAPSQNGLSVIYHRMLGHFHMKGIELVKKVSIDTTIESFLSMAATLYSGHVPMALRSSRAESVSALVSRGLCFYPDSTCELSDTPESLSHVYIVPGSIVLEQRSFLEMRDVGFQALQYPATRVIPVSEIPADTPSIPDDFTLEPLAMEMETHLLSCYRFSSARGDAMVPPAALATWAASLQGCIACTAAFHRTIWRDYRGIRIVEGEGHTEMHSPSEDCVLRFVAGTGPGWCLASMSALE